MADPMIRIEAEYSSPMVRCAFRFGVWAATTVPGCKDTWTVTHVPTGRGAAEWVLTREQAVAVCAIVGHYYPQIGARQKPRAKRMPKGWPDAAAFLSKTLAAVSKATP